MCEVFKIKTLVELFDGCQIENVIAGLRFQPEKIVFVGFKEIMTKKKTNALCKFFELRGLNIQFEFEIVGRYDFKSIVDKLNFVVDNNPDCHFDLTGGKELVLTAMGVVSALRNVPMFQINVRTGDIIRVSNCEEIIETEKNVLKLSEAIALNGCSIIYTEGDDFEWDLTNDFLRDIETIWKISSRNCGLWNRQSNVFESFERLGKINEKFVVSANIKHMKEGKHDVLLNNRIIGELIKAGLILDYAQNEEIITFRYKNAQVHQCISKAGNILELYAYVLLKEITVENPEYYDDMDIGVYIDWDGIIHDDTTEERDTKNEIDIMLMRDLVPLFVSCKNGEVKKEALYELATVAERFGGKYAKKYMLTTYICSDPESRKYILQRAKDMNITIIEGLEKMKREEIKTTLRKKVK